MRSQVITAVAALAAPSACQGLWPRQDADYQALSQALSTSAKVYYPGSTDFVDASTRWSNLDLPTVNIVVSPATENDVVETVSFSPRWYSAFRAHMISRPGLGTIIVFFARRKRLANVVM